MNGNLMFENGVAVATLSEILLPYCRRKELSVAEPAVCIYGLAGGIPALFEEVMLKEQFFTRYDCSLPVLCDRMRTNRTYISTLVHTLFGMKYRDVVSALRIEYAKSMLVERKDMPIEEMASSCGFVYSSQFDRKFHELVGSTPFEWRRANAGDEKKR